MNNVVVIADDLTGAADTGVQFCPFVADTTLVSYQQLEHVLQSTPASASRAIAVYTNSRALAAEAAKDRLVSVAQELAKIPPFWIYKKIDSCMRGNVAAEADALLDVLGFEVSFITPAFPEMGRTTENDIHRVHGVPLDQTEIARDPITPVKESYLSRIVQTGSSYPVDHVAAAFLNGPEKKMQAEIKRQILRGFRHFVFDAASRYHLDRIAGLVQAFPGKVLPVGSAGLAGSLCKPLSPINKAIRLGPIPESAGGNLLVCGTASDVTGRQIDYLLDKHSYERIQLPPLMLADQKASDDFSLIVSSARANLLRKNVVLTIDAQQNKPPALRPANLQQAAESIVRGLGFFVAEVVAAVKPANLFLTGGDTADAVLTTIGAEGIRIMGEVVPGVVRGALFGGPLNGLPLVTKAGAFGRQDTLAVLHEYWQRLKVSGVRFQVSAQSPDAEAAGFNGK